jgi:hypothetical protein
MPDDNSMDVDDPKATLLPSLMPPPSAPSWSGRVQEADDRWFKEKRWPDRITNAGSNKEELQFVLTMVLTVCGSIASSVTALKENFITLSFSDIDKLVKSLNDDEVEEWKNIVQKGDWAGVITHPMYLARFRRRYIVMRYRRSETSGTS